MVLVLALLLVLILFGRDSPYTSCGSRRWCSRSCGSSALRLAAARAQERTASIAGNDGFRVLPA